MANGFFLAGDAPAPQTPTLPPQQRASIASELLARALSSPAPSNIGEGIFSAAQSIAAGLASKNEAARADSEQAKLEDQRRLQAQRLAEAMMGRPESQSAAPGSFRGAQEAGMPDAGIIPAQAGILPGDDRLARFAQALDPSTAEGSQQQQALYLAAIQNRMAQEAAAAEAERQRRLAKEKAATELASGKELKGFEFDLKSKADLAEFQRNQAADLAKFKREQAALVGTNTTEYNRRIEELRLKQAHDFDLAKQNAAYATEQTRLKSDLDAGQPYTIGPGDQRRVGSEIIAEARPASKLLTEDEFQQQLELRAAGKPTTEVKVGETESVVKAKTLGNVFEQQLKTMEEQQSQFRDLEPRLLTIATLLEGGNVETGQFERVWLPVRQWSQSFGLTVDENLPQAEQVSSAMQFIIPRMRVSGSGSTSDFEMRAFRDAVPNYANTTAGNAMLARSILQIQERNRGAYDLALGYYAEKGTLQGFGDYADQQLGTVFPTPQTQDDYDAIEAGTVYFDDEGGKFMVKR